MFAEFCKISERGGSLQVTVPKTMVTMLGLSKGDYMRVTLDGDRVVMVVDNFLKPENKKEKKNDGKK